jgi:hypothetical protein
MENFSRGIDEMKYNDCELCGVDGIFRDDQPDDDCPLCSMRARAEKAEQVLTQEGMGTYCAYCGQRFELDDDAATLVSQHISTCGKHPMRAIVAERDCAMAQLDNSRKSARAWKALSKLPWLFLGDTTQAILKKLMAFESEKRIYIRGGDISKRRDAKKG